jgi:glycosyltransferase involved in cell wall biosynthesis
MISVIIPLMPIPPYDEQIEKCLRSLKKQTADHEVIVQHQKPQRFIEKNRLLNEGIDKSSGDIIWFCDADFILDDVDLLSKMQSDVEDVIYPMFYSRVFKGYKIADGSPFIKREVLEEFGELDESLIGIGGVTFGLLNWCLKNTKFNCSPDYLIRLNYFPFVHFAGKAPQKTIDKTKDVVEQTEKILKMLGVWPE